MSEEKKPVSFYLKIMPFSGYLLYFSLGLFFFFISAFMVILVRTKSDTNIIMPDLVGQNYIDVHNELMRLRLKVRIESKRYTDKNDGEILYQSISPGKKLESGSKLYLTVNDGVDRVIIPDFRGQQLNSARALIDKTLSGDTYVSMTIGGITYIPISEGLSADTVVDQIPFPGKNTSTREKIYLLVTESGNKNDKASSINNSLEGNPFPFVANSLQKQKIPFRIKEILNTKDRRENGLIVKSEKVGNVLQFAVSLFPLKEKNIQGYETISFKPNSSEKYSARLQNIDSDNPSSEIFSSLDLEGGENFQYVFYRVGDVRVDLMKGKDSLNSITYKSDYKK